MNRVAIVTGGTSGIGLATANALKAAGLTVYVLSRHAAELPGLLHIAADVADEKALAAAIGEIYAREGRLSTTPVLAFPARRNLPKTPTRSAFWTSTSSAWSTPRKRRCR